MNHKVFIYVLFLSSLLFAEVHQAGKVTEFNSGKKPLSNIIIKLPKSCEITQAITDNRGNFTLVFPKQSPGETVPGVIIFDENYEIVNQKDFQDGWALRKDTIKIFLAKRGLLDAARTKYYNISMSSIEKRYKEDNDKLQKKLDNKEIERKEFESQRDSLAKKCDDLEKKLPDFADYFARINKDEIGDIDARALACFERGEIDSAIQVIKLSGIIELFKKQRQIKDSLSLLINNEKGTIQDYIKYCELRGGEKNLADAADCLESIAKDDTTDISAVINIADFLRNQHYYDRALFWYEIAARNSVKDEGKYSEAVFGSAYIADVQNQSKRAEQLYKQVLNIMDRQKKKNSEVFNHNFASVLMNLAVLQKGEYRYPEAEKNYEESLRMFRSLAVDNPKVNMAYVAGTLVNLALLQTYEQKYIEAEKNYEESLQTYRELAVENPSVNNANVAGTLMNLALLQQIERSYTEAEKNYTESLKIRRKLAEGNPKVYNPDVAMTLMNLASLQQDEQRYPDAEKNYEESLRLYYELAVDNPKVYNSDVAMTLANLAVLQQIEQRYPEAEKNYEESLRMFRILAVDNPKMYNPDVAKALMNLAVFQVAEQRYPEAEKNYKESLRMYRELAAENPEVNNPGVARTLTNLAKLQSDELRNQEAEENHEESLRMFRVLAKDKPKVYNPDVAMTLTYLAFLREAEQSYSEAEKNHKEALKIYRELAADNPQMYNPYIATASMNVEAVLWKLASLQHQAKRYKSVEQIYKELLNLYKEMTGRDGELYNQKIATTYGNLSFIQIFNNEFSDAIISAEQGIKYDSTQIWIYANMAHGYLLSGNFEKAKEIYLTYKDVDLNGKTFAQSCLEDFDEFAKAGIVNPDIEKIKELLKK